MEEQNDILTAVKEGFARVDQQFARVDQQFARVDQQFARVDQQFAKVDQQFANIDQQFARVDQQFAKVDQQFAKVDQQFAKVDQQFLTLRREFAEQLDGVSDGLHLELKAQSKKLLEGAEAIRASVERVDSKLGLVGENVANVMTEIGRYHANVEAPLEARVTSVEGRIWALEHKK